jgi:hypothetical protein
MPYGVRRREAGEIEFMKNAPEGTNENAEVVLIFVSETLAFTLGDSGRSLSLRQLGGRWIRRLVAKHVD